MHMETTTIKTTTTPTRHTAVNALAIVGFIVLVIIGMALAVYAARFVPATISRVGSAAVYLSSQVFPADNGESDLVVVPPTETVPFGDDADVATSTPATTTPATTPATTGTTPRAGTPTTITVPVQVPASVNYSGLPDLVLENVQTGYLRGTDVSTFRASRDVPDNERGAVKFTIANRGTNIVTDDFKFQFRINTSPSINKDYKVTRELRPNERIEYTLWFDRVRSNDDRTITIDIDSDNDVRESNENNNDETARIDIEN
jgi:hypothetical protein